MYGKIFVSIYNGTLRNNWKGLITFQQLIILSDSDGIVDMTPEAISDRTNIPLEIIEEGLEFLAQPDENSRTPDMDGRRIIPLDDNRKWGWFLVNHEKYKGMKTKEEIREANRERKRRQREKAKQLQRASQDVTPGHAKSQHTDTYTDSNKNKNPPYPLTGDREINNQTQLFPLETPKEGAKPRKGIKKKTFNDLTADQQSGFDKWWAIYKRKENKETCRQLWTKLDPSLELMALIYSATVERNKTPSWTAENGKYVVTPDKYLRKRKWEDEIETDSGKEDWLEEMLEE